MNIDACIRIGRVIKSHGVRGEVRVDLELKNPQEFENKESVFVEIDGKLVPFFIESTTFDGKSAIIKFEGMDSRDDINMILNRFLYLDKKDFAETDSGLQVDESSNALIIGFEVSDLTGGVLGVVEEIEEGPQDRLVVKGEKGEILIPVCEPIIREIDRKSGRITVDLPDGFLDLYN